MSRLRLSQWTEKAESTTENLDKIKSEEKRWEKEGCETGS